MPFSEVRRKNTRAPIEEPEAVDNRREDAAETDPNESDRARKLREAMEATQGGDTRKDKSRY